jgi:hypothetical protein
VTDLQAFQAIRWPDQIEPAEPTTLPELRDVIHDIARNVQGSLSGPQREKLIRAIPSLTAVIAATNGPEITRRTDA